MTNLTKNRIAAGNFLCFDCAHTYCPLILPDRESLIKYLTREAIRNEEIQFDAAFP